MEKGCAQVWRGVHESRKFSAASVLSSFSVRGNVVQRWEGASPNSPSQSEARTVIQISQADLGTRSM